MRRIETDLRPHIGIFGTKNRNTVPMYLIRGVPYRCFELLFSEGKSFFLSWTSGGKNVKVSNTINASHWMIMTFQH